MVNKPTIAVLGTGDMGSAVGGALVRAGYRVVTDLSGRSRHSRTLAATARLEDVGSLAAVVQNAGLVLSIVPPGAAHEVAADVAAAMLDTRAQPTYVDCNAVAPATVQTIGRLFEATQAAFIDAGIVGRPPRADGGEQTRFYVAGEARGTVLRLELPEIAMHDMGERIGAASALKMAYASLTKGTDALLTAVLLAAERLGVRGPLMAELAASQGEALARMHARVPYLAATAQRFMSEMNEIAATYASVGVTPDFHRGAEWIYRRLASTPLAAETRATLEQRTLDEALRVFAAAFDDGADRLALE